MLREFSAGGVVYKKENEKVLWLITLSTPSKLFPKPYWRLPKGWLDDKNGGKEPGPLGSGAKKATEKELKSTALREVKEEGGVNAKIITKIGTDTYFLKRGVEKIMKFATFYLMQYLSDTPEGHDFETSEIAWLPFEVARKRLTHGGSKKILDKALGLM